MISFLTAEKLACARGERQLFSGLSFRVRAGQALAADAVRRLREAGLGDDEIRRLFEAALTRRGGSDA